MTASRSGSSKAGRVLSFGEPLVAFYPSDTSGGLSTSYSLTWGGDSSNFSIAAAKLGLACTYLTRVGKDVFGRGFLDLWRGHGVDVSAVQVDPERRTGLYVATFSAGRHELVYYRSGSAAANIDRNEIDWTVLDGVSVVHLTGISQAISPQAEEVSLELMARAKKRGILVSYDVNYRPALWPAERARAALLESVAGYVDVLEITDEEMAMLSLGERPDDLADALPRLPQFCAVKLGARGSTLQSPKGRCSARPLVVPFRDSVGAGDAYDAALITAILEGMELRDAARFANAAGAFTCTGVGPLEKQPRRKDIERLLAESTH